jgi:hypothetical protein
MEQDGDVNPKLLGYGTLHYEGLSTKDRGDYPWSYFKVIDDHITQNVMNKVIDSNPDIIVIEETNKGKNRYSQKKLEWLHHELLRQIGTYKCPTINVVYLDTSAWRSTLGIWMNKDQKKQNAKLSKAKSEGTEALKAMKQKLGVRGRVNKKHVAINHVNATFNLNLRVKDNDAADAICLGLAYFKGATPSNGA